MVVVAQTFKRLSDVPADVQTARINGEVFKRLHLGGWCRWSGPVFECPCCGAYHPIEFESDCRDDTFRLSKPGAREVWDLCVECGAPISPYGNCACGDFA